MKNTRVRRRQIRSSKGVLATILLLLVLQICFLAASLSVDIAHQVSVRAELQAATDAAAMAGEEVILAQTPANSQAAVLAAQTICNKNVCDGMPLSQNSTAQIVADVGTTGGTPSLPTVQVTASVKSKNFFGLLFGRGSDVLTASSTAGPGEINTAFVPFPLTVVNRQYLPNTTYTWYISDAPGLVPSLVTALSSGLTGYSDGSTLPTYPNNMLGTNTARFLTTYNSAGNGGVLGAVQSLANGVGGPLGLGSPGTVLGGIVDSTVGTTGSTASALLTGSSSAGPDTSALSMLDYWSQNASSSQGNGSFQLTANTQPSANLGVYPALPSVPLAIPSITVGQQILTTSGANSVTNNVLNTTGQFLQGSSGNHVPGSLTSTYMSSNSVTGPGLPSSTNLNLSGSVASWLQGQTIIIPISTPAPVQSSLTVPIININLLGTSDSTQSTFSTGGTGLLGGVVAPLTGVSNASPTGATIDRFIAVKITSVTVEYQGARGLGLLGLNLLNNPWAQQVTRITGVVQPASGGAGYGSSSHAGASPTGAYAAMLIN